MFFFLSGEETYAEIELGCLLEEPILEFLPLGFVFFLIESLLGHILKEEPLMILKDN